MLLNFAWTEAEKNSTYCVRFAAEKYPHIKALLFVSDTALSLAVEAYLLQTSEQVEAYSYCMAEAIKAYDFIAAMQKTGNSTLAILERIEAEYHIYRNAFLGNAEEN